MRNSPQAIGLILVIIGVVPTLPLQAAQLSFDEPTTERKTVVPTIMSNCAQESHSNLTSRSQGMSPALSQTLNLRSNLIADNTSVSSDSGLLQPNGLVVAQAFEDDCCAIGGIDVDSAAFEDAALCDISGVPPAGGVIPAAGVASTGGFPFPVLAALAPAAAVPMLIGGGDSNPTRTPTSTSTSVSTPTSTSTPSATSIPTPTPPPTKPPEKVPEPSTMAGLLIGGAVLGVYAKRRQQSTD